MLITLIIFSLAAASGEAGEGKGGEEMGGREEPFHLFTQIRTGQFESHPSFS